jgi:hypothetical protein
VGSATFKGESQAFRIGGVAPSREGAKVETANVKPNVFHHAQPAPSNRKTFSTLTFFFFMQSKIKPFISISNKSNMIEIHSVISSTGKY